MGRCGLGRKAMGFLTTVLHLDLGPHPQVSPEKGEQSRDPWPTLLPWKLGQSGVGE